MTRTRRTPRRRAAMYMTVLMTAMLVTVIGLGGLMAARARFHGAAADERAMQARFYAQSAVDLGIQHLRSTANWRSTLTNDAWQPDQTVGAGALTWKVVDDADGVLADDLNERIRLVGSGAIGETVRTYSVQLDPPEATPNLLRNPGFESGLTDWTNTSSAATSSSVSPHGGSKCVLMAVRLASTASVYQDVSGVIQKDLPHYVEVWAQTAALTENVTIALQTTGSSSGTTLFLTGSTVVGNSWTKVTGTLTPTWSGTLTDARWMVFSYPDGGTLSFYIDDAVMRLATDPTELELVPGTWRREVTP